MAEARRLSGCCAILALIFTVFCVEGVLEGNSTVEESPQITEEEDPYLDPTVFIPILARNKAHSLPMYLGNIERLKYPKQRISLWIHSDHNIDNTTNILQEWVSHVRHMYHRVDVHFSEEPSEYESEKGPNDWPAERLRHLLDLRQKALDEARKQWADFIFFVDCDNFIEEPETLQWLMSQRKIVVAPMLESRSAYSNFWCGISESGYYRRTPEYMPTFKRQRKGCFPVPMVHSTFLVDLRKAASEKLQFTPLESYRGDIDDILTFAHSAREADVHMYILNSVYFGQLLIPSEYHETLEDTVEQMLHLNLESSVDRSPLKTSDYVTVTPRPVDKLGFDEIYMINLARRRDRRERMFWNLEQLGIDFKHFEAVDGNRDLTKEIIQDMGIVMLPGFADPYHGRELTMGEIGCFLSHYRIWQEVVNKSYSKVMVLEDDIRFHFKFRERLQGVMNELRELHINWDLVYIGRKRLDNSKESYVRGSRRLVWPYYTYWTLGYILSQKGAQKLLDGDPLPKLVPVDEYLPIMFDRHPEDDWAQHFGPRDLLALSAEPLLIEPTHYTGEPNYFSDTEASALWKESETDEEHDEL
ncbi:procollagen galactosyltransferase 2-like [Ptychodera flava]|uniref:procollagen galactosyltransferase 2-like n=1 Tax=Ptychodera flava TaxID=63121 RepID=UPI003969C754